MSAMGSLDYIFIEEMVRDLTDDEVDRIYIALDGKVKMVDSLRREVPVKYIGKFIDLIDEYGITTVGTALLDMRDEIEDN